MLSDLKRLKKILTINIISLLIWPVFIALSYCWLLLKMDATPIIVFAIIFAIIYIALNLVSTVISMNQDWKSKWALKYNVCFALLGLFFGWLIFMLFAGIGKTKLRQELKHLLKQENESNKETNN